ncbi:hypothetical protein M406DRAFT_109204 [Cryphonectria parasitica EP155]|uniref:Uncharacterized protein n=1 Tax=Cryphonectria parasitica (strain ATCC 38755 / EP155) TaxID=660469 RepID=A0A9P5CR84_CRYP1|nr:uncharacterized protein M406DRAFT_109204 [Cryphonectria parasitica EP155]KAF3768289.1 hypothetical protein M406DRAFT_109204 [Cryphonectria parasitica EP155]
MSELWVMPETSRKGEMGGQRRSGVSSGRELVNDALSPQANITKKRIPFSNISHINQRSYTEADTAQTCTGCGGKFNHVGYRPHARSTHRLNLPQAPEPPQPPQYCLPQDTEGIPAVAPSTQGSRTRKLKKHRGKRQPGKRIASSSDKSPDPTPSSFGSSASGQYGSNFRFPSHSELAGGSLTLFSRMEVSLWLKRFDWWR